MARIKKILKHLLTGLTVPQEYICVDKGRFQNTVSVFLVVDPASPRIDVTNRHVFIGYKPVIMALMLPDTVARLEKHPNVRMEFCHGQNVIATLVLRKDRIMLIGSTPIIFYQGVGGKHAFIHPLHQIVDRLRQRLKKSKPDNVALPGTLYDQVRIAYCVPREIGIITVGTSESMNMFPTDLHGIVTDDYYISSLRIGGAATQQVERNGKIVLATVDGSAFRAVYALGPNHMHEPVPNTALPCLGESSVFHIPLSSYTVSYRELERLSSIDIGIHRIHVYSIISSQKVKQTDSVLAHVHGYYAQWRIDKNIFTDMLIR